MVNITNQSYKTLNICVTNQKNIMAKMLYFLLKIGWLHNIERPSLIFKLNSELLEATV